MNTREILENCKKWALENFSSADRDVYVEAIDALINNGTDFFNTDRAVRFLKIKENDQICTLSLLTDIMRSRIITPQGLIPNSADLGNQLDRLMNLQEKLDKKWKSMSPTDPDLQNFNSVFYKLSGNLRSFFVHPDFCDIPLRTTTITRFSFNHLDNLINAAENGIRAINKVVEDRAAEVVKNNREKSIVNQRMNRFCFSASSSSSSSSSSKPKEEAKKKPASTGTGISLQAVLDALKLEEENEANATLTGSTVATAAPGFGRR